MAGLRSPTEELRHPAELRLLVAGTLAFIVLVVLAAYLLDRALGPAGVAALIATIFLLYVARGLLNASERANSVEITPDQFPDVHRRIERYATLFGLTETPTAYMAQEGGTLNAFASKHNRVNFIRINSDLLEIGEFGVGPRERDTRSLDFIIAHELGHVAAKHTTYWYAYIAGFVFYVPFLGAALSRAREYTADNHGYEAVPDGVDAIVVLSGGKYLYQKVEGEQIARRASTDKGVFVWIVNALSSHPIISKRLDALYDRSRPGSIF